MLKGEIRIGGLVFLCKRRIIPASDGARTLVKTYSLIPAGGPLALEKEQAVFKAF